MSIREVNVDELEVALADGALLIDVRETNEYIDGHVTGAIHVPLGTVPDRIDAFRADGPVYVICRSGARSMRACETVRDEDIDAINVAGGTLAWISSGRSVVTGPNPA
jgi:rhodanese-related sulfurtransferase